MYAAPCCWSLQEGWRGGGCGEQWQRCGVGSGTMHSGRKNNTNPSSIRFKNQIQERHAADLRGRRPAALHLDPPGDLKIWGKIQMIWGGRQDANRRAVCAASPQLTASAQHTAAPSPSLTLSNDPSTNTTFPPLIKNNRTATTPSAPAPLTTPASAPARASRSTCRCRPAPAAARTAARSSALYCPRSTLLSRRSYSRLLDMTPATWTP